MQNQIILSDQKLIIVNKEESNFIEIRNLLIEGKVEEAIELASSGKLKERIESLGYELGLSGQNLVIQGYEINNSLSRYIVDKVKNSGNVDLLANFISSLNKLANNKTVFDSIWDFLKYNDDIIITDNTQILCYKAVNSEYKDKYSGTIDNSPGTVVSMPKSQVDNNRDNGCSEGLHVGSLKNYVRDFASSNSDKILLVSVNLEDIISVPHDSSYGKMRVSEYYVIADITDIKNEDYLVEEIVNLKYFNFNNWSYVRNL